MTLDVICLVVSTLLFTLSASLLWNDSTNSRGLHGFLMCLNMHTMMDSVIAILK